ncbi:MAG: DUF1987 domain-containing protein [Cyclobacteriaceae bacterium]
MKELVINSTAFTPAIIFDPEEKYFSITGVSIPEDTPKFYQPVFELFESMSTRNLENLLIEISLVHFNSSTSKALFTLFKLVKKLRNKMEIEIKWQCDPDDEDMQEIIEDYSDALDLDIRIIMIEFE